MKPGLALVRRFDRSAREHLGRTTVAYAVLAVGLLLTALAFYYVRQDTVAAENARFEESARTIEWAVDRRMNVYSDAMLAARGLFAASEFVTREEWHRYVAASDLMRRYPGMRAIAYAERVPLESRGDNVSRVREEGVRDYELRPPGERFEYFPLVYLEPAGEENRPLLGYDFYAGRVSRDAMEQARDTGLPRASGKVEALGEGLRLEDGFLLYAPVYRRGAPTGTVDERRAALQGYVVGIFRADELLRGIFGEQPERDLDFEVYDGADLTRETLLYDGDGTRRAGAPGAGRLSGLRTLEMGGRIWTLNFAATPGFEDGWRNELPFFVLLSGLSVSLMLFGITWMLSTSRARAERFGLELELANRELGKTNRDLEETNRELEGTNRELEAFSYSVSHDLRAPLRSIEGFSQILLEDHAGELNEEGRDYLGRVGAASRHMARLIDDLLDLSRVTRSEMRHETVDLSRVVREICAELREEDPDREVEFVVADGLIADGDARLLRVVLENLLGNAWKFTSGKERATIEFGSTVRDGARAYYVRDDGAGFDMRYAGKLFGAFQRLHPAEEFEGTGIGLATVARIVHRHGGRVWAEGEPGRGATFFFTLKP